MRIKRNTYQKICHVIASNIRDLVKHHDFSVLGLATGSTPIGIYKELSYMKDTDFSNTLTYNLDEYVGLDKHHSQSYEHFMNKHLFGKLTFHSNHFPTEKLLPYYDAMIENSKGIDIQILGIGTNGHIAFNEPGTPRDSKSRIVDLTENTIKDNSRFFDSMDEVPTHARTMGIDTIMKSKRIYLIALGKHKKDIQIEFIR